MILSRVTLSWLSLLWLVVILAGCTKTPEEQIKDRMREMLSLMKNGQFRQLVVEYADPDFVAHLRKRKRLDHVVKVFRLNKSKRLAGILEKALTVKPVFDKTGKQAIFELPDSPRRLRFKYSDKYKRWYLMN